jgi:hypothetical protein
MAIYQSPKFEPMWDTWLFQAGDDFHLFFLSNGIIGRAVSRDLINWTRLQPIAVAAQKGDWDEKGMHITGYTVKCQDEYLMSYGPEIGQPIGMMISSDLLTWKSLPANPVLLPQPPYSSNAWRDLSACYDQVEKIWHGYLCADVENVPCIAHLTSADYIHWDYHDPIYISQDFVEFEVPEYFRLGSKHYLLFSSVRSRKDTSGRQDAGGTWYLAANQRNGPYCLPKDPLLLGFGRGRYDHYVGRIIDFHGLPLLYHQTFGEGPVVWGFPKVVRQIDQEELKLFFWEDLCQLETRVIYQQDQIISQAEPGKTNIEQLGLQNADCMITLSVDCSQASEFGIVWRFMETRRHGLESGVGLLLNMSLDQVSLVDVKRIRNFQSNTVTCCLRDDFRGCGMNQESLHVRILTRSHISEVYLNEQWIFSMDISDLPPQGDIGFLTISGTATIKNLRIAEILPLKVAERIEY